MAVKLVRLKSGEDIIADILTESAEIVKVKNPAMLMPMSDGRGQQVQVGLAPWMPFSEAKEFELPRDWVLLTTEPAQDIVNNYIISYVGEDKIIPKVRKTDVLFHAQRGIQELSYDTLRSSKSQEIEIPPDLTMALPHDYVNYVKLSWKDDNGVEKLLLPARKTSNPLAILQDSNYKYLFDNDGVLLEAQDSDTWNEYKGLDDNVGDTGDGKDYIDEPTSAGRRYGLEPENGTANGLFYVDQKRGKIYFSSSMNGKTITLKYISDSLGTSGEIKVHKFAEEAIYKWIAYAIASTHTSVSPNYIPLLKRERFAAIRQAKLRLSNLKSEEIAQIMRGKSKFIKH